MPGSLLPQRRSTRPRSTSYIADHPGLVRRPRRRPGSSTCSPRPGSRPTYLPAVRLADRLHRAAAEAARAAMLVRPPAVAAPARRLPQSATRSRRRTARTRWRPAGGGRSAARLEDRGPGSRRRRVVTVAAERGYPAGRPATCSYHTALVVLLAGVALGQALGLPGHGAAHRGPAGICNAVPLYDSFRPGKLVDGSGLAARSASTRSTSFSVAYDPGGHAGTSSCADITYSRGEDGRAPHYDLEVNHPLRVEGARVYLVGPRLRPRCHGHQAGRTGGEGRVGAVPAARPEHAAVRGRGEAAGRRCSRRWRCTARRSVRRRSSGREGRRSLSRTAGNPGVASEVYRGRLGVRRVRAAVRLRHRPAAGGDRRAEAGRPRRSSPGQVGDAGRRHEDITFDGYRECGRRSRSTTIPARRSCCGRPARWCSGFSFLSRCAGADSSCGSPRRPAPIRKLWTTRRLWDDGARRTATPVVWSPSGAGPHRRRQLRHGVRRRRRAAPRPFARQEGLAVPVNAGLATLSDHMFTWSIILYSLALVAYCGEYAFGRRGKSPRPRPSRCWWRPAPPPGPVHRP
jgi:hypothetical protein